MADPISRSNFSKRIGFFEKMKRTNVIRLPLLQNLFLHSFSKDLISSEEMPLEAESSIISAFYFLMLITSAIWCFKEWQPYSERSKLRSELLLYEPTHLFTLFKV